MIASLFLFLIFAFGVIGVISMVLRKLGLDSKEVLALFLLAAAALVVSTVIIFFTTPKAF
ncbi:MAG: hypothetical protein Q7R55_00315 [Candidatus Wildermuthbacteria bacterium]|nr:hypothetical protein [Candidatus Wildermuthbacteria bacterium]